MLYIVATPLGNLADITYRAVQILGSVDIVCAEDSRRTGLLVQKIIEKGDKLTENRDEYRSEKIENRKGPIFNFESPNDLPLSDNYFRPKLITIHEHSTDDKIDWLISELKNGKHVALVTDAGTPGIADPGGRVVEKAVVAGIEVSPIPGPSSLAAILSVTGWLNEPLSFVGYLPKKKGRETLLTQISKVKSQKSKLVKTLVFFESPNRINRTIKELVGYLGEDCNVVVGRELTKQFEEIVRGTLGELSQRELKEKGEFVVAIKLLT